MTQKQPRPPRTQYQHYTYIAIAFLVAGIIFAAQESSRLFSIAFFALALVYFILAQNKSKEPPESPKK